MNPACFFFFFSFFFFKQSSVGYTTRHDAPQRARVECIPQFSRPLKPILIHPFNYLKPCDYQSHGSTDFNSLKLERECETNESVGKVEDPTSR